MKKLESLSFPSTFLCVLLLIGVCCGGEDEGVTAPMKRTEQEALYSCIQDLVGAWWNGSDLYPDPCGWTPIQGVSCDFFDGFWYVTDLAVGPVHDNSLVCDQDVGFSRNLFALRHLKSLSFFNCFVSPLNHPVSIPSQNWQAFSDSLTSLEFRSNPGLTGRIPSTFNELKNLESLILTENGLTEEIPSGIGDLTSLKRLNLAGNRLTGEIPDTFSGLSRLLILDFSRNSLSGPLPPSFGQLTSLLKLDSNNNQLYGKIPTWMGNLKNLTLLDLSNNNFTGGLIRSLQELLALEGLILANNPIGGSLASLEWDHLTGLSALDLSNTSLTGGLPESFSKLKGLRFLGLNGNQLTGEISPKLAALPNVSAIHIHENNLTGELKFSELFYLRMGRRFAAWGNPNLCCPAGLVRASHVPFGVKLCTQDHKIYYKQDTSITWDTKANVVRGSNTMVSPGMRSSEVRALVVLIEVLVMIVSLNLGG